MTNNAVRIQPVTIAEVARLRTVALKAYRDHYLHLWHDGGEWYMQKSFSLGRLGWELQDSNARFYLVNDHESPVGFVKLNINAPFGDFAGATALELERIYLIKAASGRGVGRAVMQFVFELAVQLNKQIVWLKVMDTSTHAINFYKKNGFEICGTYILGFEQMKKELRGMYVMRKELAHG